MRMTALDVQNHNFPRRFKGYDIDEVEHFRSALVEDWADLTGENEGLRRRVAELESRVRELDAHEIALRNALVTAQGMSDELRRTSEHEAQMRVGQAELTAEKILAAAHRQATRLAQDVRELRGLRSQLAGSVRATIETHLALLEGFSQDPEDATPPALEARLTALTGAPEANGAEAEPAPQSFEFEIGGQEAAQATPTSVEASEASAPAASEAREEAAPAHVAAAAENPATAAPARPAAENLPGAEAVARSSAADGANSESDASQEASEPRTTPIRKLDSYVIPGGKAKAPAAAAPGETDPNRTWTILPGQG